MKNLFLLALISFCFHGQVVAEEISLQTLPPGMVLNDSNRPVETRNTLNDAITANRIDILYLAIHNRIDVAYCIDHIKDMERSKQGQLLIKLLRDEDFIQPFSKIKDGFYAEQFGLRQALGNICSRLLNEPLSSIHLKTREDLDALATKLQSVK